MRVKKRFRNTVLTRTVKHRIAMMGFALNLLDELARAAPCVVVPMPRSIRHPFVQRIWQREAARPAERREAEKRLRDLMRGEWTQEGEGPC